MFVHVFSEGSPVIALPKLKANITGASLIDVTTVEYVETKTGTLVKLPDKGRDSIDTVVVLQFDGQPVL